MKNCSIRAVGFAAAVLAATIEHWLRNRQLAGRSIFAITTTVAVVIASGGVDSGVALATRSTRAVDAEAVVHSSATQTRAADPTQSLRRSIVSRVAATTLPLTWSAPSYIDDTGDLTSVSCPSASFCMAVDGTRSRMRVDESLTWNGTSWSAPTNIGTSHGFDSVSCASASFCMAVNDASGDTYSWNGTSWATDVDPGRNLSFDSVSCPSTTFCMAVYGGAGYTWNGTSWSTAILVPDPSYFGYLLSSVSCSSASFCMALDDYGNAFTWNGASWSGPIGTSSHGISDRYAVGFDLSCASASFCMAVDSGGNAFTWSGASWSGPSDSGGGLSVSCRSASFCVGLGADSHWELAAVTWNGASWSAPTEIDSHYGQESPSVASVSCASASFCMAVSQDGYAVRTGTKGPGAASCRNPVGPPSTPDYCALSDWRAHTEKGSKTPGREPLNVIISARSNISLDDIYDGLTDWSKRGCEWTVSPETADVTGSGGYIPQQEAWRRGGCLRGAGGYSFDGNEDHIRFWRQPIPGTNTEAWFGTASYETACFVIGEPPNQQFLHFDEQNPAFIVRHWGDKWHCIDGGPGSYGSDGYNAGAETFVADLKNAATAHGWDVTPRVVKVQAGIGLDGVPYSNRVDVVTVTKAKP